MPKKKKKNKKPSKKKKVKNKKKKRKIQKKEAFQKRLRIIHLKKLYLEPDLNGLKVV